MEEPQQETQTPDSTITFYDKVNWDAIGFNRITKEDFLRLKARNKKSYATLLGNSEELSFFMFKPLMWPEYKEIKERELNKYETQEYVINTCLLWPKQDTVSLNTLEAGLMTTLVYQIMAVSYFLTDPSKALEMIIEIA
jgi:hypothetical protein